MQSFRHHHSHPLKVIADYAITLGQSGESALLCNDRAVFLPAHQLLVISDLHMGKSTYFRRAGIAVPQHIVQRDLERLRRLIAHYQAKRVVIAGDFFHAHYNREFETFLQWRESVAQVQFDLVLGNHDRLSKTLYQRLGFALWSSYLPLTTKAHTDDRLHITHQPLEYLDSTNHSAFMICGHIHPGVSIGRSKRHRISLPCFMVDAYQLIMPAYSLFTGLDTRYAPQYATQQTMKKYALTDSEVIPISP